MELSICVWIFVVVMYLDIQCTAMTRGQPGLLDFLGGDNQQMGRSLPSATHFSSLARPLNTIDPNRYAHKDRNNESPNINLLSIFPQNNAPASSGNLQLDPETRETLEDQKEKLEDVLERLKDLNKQKEEAQKGLSTTEGRTNNNYFNNWGLTTKPTRPLETTTKKLGKQGVFSTERSVQNDKIWKKLTKTQFLFQAHPVVPENEMSRVRLSESVYYLD